MYKTRFVCILLYTDSSEMHVQRTMFYQKKDGGCQLRSCHCNYSYRLSNKSHSPVVNKTGRNSFTHKTDACIYQQAREIFMLVTLLHSHTMTHSLFPNRLLGLL